ncbi:hypothetical protein DFJ73DRAFT_41885 [Zopfochytrium polystomum]|nr:hypothetical protein DFJ73DRAFT_41885 [Zopfochytrium polystomum]
MGLKPRFSEPFDDFLARLLDSLDTFCARRNPEREHDQHDNDNPCDVIPSSLAAAAFGAAPKGSNWTVWVSHELMVRFKSTKDRFCPGAKHGEFVELLFLLQSLESSPDRDTSQLVPAAVALNAADSIAPSTQPPSSPVEKSTDRTDGWGKYLPGNSRRRSIPLRASELSTASDPPDSGLSRKRSVLQTCELLIKGIGRKPSIPSTHLPRANPPSLAEASPSYSLLPFLFPNNTTRRPDDVLPPYLDHVSGANATHDPPQPATFSHVTRG